SSTRAPRCSASVRGSAFLARASSGRRRSSGARPCRRRGIGTRTTRASPCASMRSRSTMLTSLYTNERARRFWFLALTTIMSTGCHYKVVAFGEIEPRAAERVVAEVVRIRGLAPREPIRFAEISPVALRREVDADLARMKTDGSIATWQKAWTRLGLLEP